MLFFCQKLAKFEINCSNYKLFLRLIYFKCMRKYAINSLKIGKNHDFSWLIVSECALLFFCINTMLFRKILTKFAIFATNRQNMYFFRTWYFFNSHSFCTNILLQPAAKLLDIDLIFFSGSTANFHYLICPL